MLFVSLFVVGCGGGATPVAPPAAAPSQPAAGGVPAGSKWTAEQITQQNTSCTTAYQKNYPQYNQAPYNASGKGLPSYCSCYTVELSKLCTYAECAANPQTYFDKMTAANSDLTCWTNAGLPN